MPCFALSHSRRSFSLSGPSFPMNLIHSSSVRPVFCFRPAIVFWNMARLGWTSYEDALCFTSGFLLQAGNRFLEHGQAGMDVIRRCPLFFIRRCALLFGYGHKYLRRRSLLSVNRGRHLSIFDCIVLRFLFIFAETKTPFVTR